MTRRKPFAKESKLLEMLIEQAPFHLPVRIFLRPIYRRMLAVSPKTGKTFRLNAGFPGQADAYALVKGGRHIELETKSARGEMREAQISWSLWCNGWGIPHLVLRAKAKELPNQTVARWIEEIRIEIDMLR